MHRVCSRLPILAVFVIAVSYPANLWGDPPPGPVAATSPSDSLPVWERWADSVLATLSLRARVAQMVVRGTSPTSGTAAIDGPVERRWISEDSIGGVIIGLDAAEPLARRTNALQQLAHVPLLVLTDIEQAPFRRPAAGEPAFPQPLILAAASHGTAGCGRARVTARLARALGIHWLLPPTGDSGRRQDRARNGARAHREPFGASFIGCADAAGLLAGTTPAVGNGETLSILDARAAGGSSSASARAAVEAIAGGADLVLVSRDHRLVIQAIQAAVRNAQVSEARIDSSVRRLLVTKARMGLANGASVDTVTAVAALTGPPVDSLASDVRRRSLVLASDPGELVPLDPRQVRSVLVVAWLDQAVATAPGLQASEAFVNELRSLLAPAGTVVESAVTTRATAPGRFEALLTRAAAADLVILAPFVGTAGTRPGSALPASVQSFFERTIARQRRAIIVSFGDPRLVPHTSATASHLIAWNPWSSSSERAAARALAGGAPLTGRLPLSLGEALPRGSGITMGAVRPAEASVHRDEATIAVLRDTLQRFLAQAVLDSAFPGAVAVVGNAAGILASASAGTLDWGPSPRPDMGTLWDLASLTKVVGLTTAMMRLVEAGTISLEDPVQRHLPEWTGPGKDRVTVRDLLTHTTGLPAFRRLYLETAERDTLIAKVFETPLDTVPGARMVYSDFGLILAGRLVERVTSESLDRHLARAVFEPLGMHETLYRPPAALLPRIAPTEFDPWRRVHVRGEVHDENTAVMGGVSAHAGLFSTARDLSRFARMYLNRGSLEGVQLAQPRTIALFTRVQDPTLSHRALGWETPNGLNSAGHRLSPAAFGHTGFTGTSLWIDTENDVFVLLLSNRVNPSRENRLVYDLRGALADAVMEVLAPVAPALAADVPPVR